MDVRQSFVCEDVLQEMLPQLAFFIKLSRTSSNERTEFNGC